MDHSGSYVSVNPTTVLHRIKKIEDYNPSLLSPEMRMLYYELVEIEFDVFQFIIPVLLYRDISEAYRSVEDQITDPNGYQ